MQIKCPPALLNEPLRLTVEGLPPGAAVKLICSTLDAQRKTWKSWATFQADQAGSLDLSDRAPIAGTYEGIDPLGLLWSMEPIENNVGVFASPPGSLFAQVQLEIGGTIACTQIVERRKEGDGIRRIEISEQGLAATLFLPVSSTPLPAILILGGASGGIPETRARLLASKGFASLAIAYFGIGHLPRKLEAIPLEYLKTAFDFLSGHPAVDPKRIHLLGVSRGAEFGLLFASLFPGALRSLAVHVPSSIAWGSFSHPSLAAWTHRGHPIPHAPFAPRPFESDKGRRAEDPIDVAALFQAILKEPQAHLPFAIAVENIRCPILSLFGEDDKTWPSSWFCEQIQNRLYAHASETPYEQIGYLDAGHLFSLPSLPTSRSSFLHLPTGLWFSFGGTPAGNAAAHSRAWKKTVEFFSAHS